MDPEIRLLLLGSTTGKLLIELCVSGQPESKNRNSWLSLNASHPPLPPPVILLYFTFHFMLLCYQVYRQDSFCQAATISLGRSVQCHAKINIQHHYITLLFVFHITCILHLCSVFTSFFIWLESCSSTYDKSHCDNRQPLTLAWLTALHQGNKIMIIAYYLSDLYSFFHQACS